MPLSSVRIAANLDERNNWIKVIAIAAQVSWAADVYGDEASISAVGKRRGPLEKQVAATKGGLQAAFMALGATYTSGLTANTAQVMSSTIQYDPKREKAPPNGPETASGHTTITSARALSPVRPPPFFFGVTPYRLDCRCQKTYGLS